MTSDLDSSGESPVELKRRRAFRVRMWVGVGCYLLANFALYGWGREAGPWHLIWALLPLLFLVWVVIVVVLRVRQMDEYQVKLYFPGLVVGFTVAMFVAVTLGTLNAAGFQVPGAGWPVAVVGMVAWGLTNLVVGAPSA